MQPDELTLVVRAEDTHIVVPEDTYTSHIPPPALGGVKVPLVNLK